MTKVPSSEEAAQVDVRAERPEHPTGPNTNESLHGVGERFDRGIGEPSLQPQADGMPPLPDRSV